jgi:hypothetical protein
VSKQATELMAQPWPEETHRNAAGELVVGGLPVVDVAETYGTPVYIYDEATLRRAMRRYREAFTQALPGCEVVYAGKAFLSTAFVQLLVEEDIGLDVVSGGELFVGLKGGMPASRISLHGNNKTVDELQLACDAGIGKIIVDNLDEIDLLADLCAKREIPMTVMLRVNPGVDVHTHKKISTGMADSKFGLPIVDGQAAAAVEQLAKTPGLHLVGYHAHVGSQLFDAGASVDAVGELLDFAVDMRNKHGVELEQLSPGGGFGIAYLESDDPPSPGRGQRLSHTRCGPGAHPGDYRCRLSPSSRAGQSPDPPGWRSTVSAVARSCRMCAPTCRWTAVWPIISAQRFTTRSTQRRSPTAPATVTSNVSQLQANTANPETSLSRISSCPVSSVVT